MSDTITFVYELIELIREIADFVWEGEETPSQQAIKNLLNRLRKKVSFDFIRNLYGEGYQLCS